MHIQCYGLERFRKIIEAVRRVFDLVKLRNQNMVFVGITYLKSVVVF